MTWCLTDDISRLKESFNVKPGKFSLEDHWRDDGALFITKKALVETLSCTSRARLGLNSQASAGC